MNVPSLLLSCAAFVLAGCTRADQPSAAGASTTATTHAIRGEIVGFDRTRNVVLIHHEEIPGYMPAMAMEFSIAGIELVALREGQRIAARMSQPVDGVFPLTGFRLLDSTQDQAVASAAFTLRQDTHTRGRDVYREIGETVPSFTLYNQDGRAISIDHFHGKHIVLNFIFTRCPVPTMCPASTAKMMALQTAAKKADVKDLELVSISFDSAFDTPSVLKAYAKARGIDTANFSFLTGPENAIRDLLAQFGVIARPGEIVFKHTLSTLLIGPKGTILHRVDGSTWSPEEFLNRL